MFVLWRRRVLKIVIDIGLINATSMHIVYSCIAIDTDQPRKHEKEEQYYLHAYEWDTIVASYY